MSRRVRSFVIPVTLSLLAGVAASCGGSRPPEGRWLATVTASGADVPFVFETTARDGALDAVFFNGPLAIRSSGSRQMEDGRLVFDFAQYGTTLDVAWDGAALVGEYRRRRGSYPFRATPAANARDEGAGTDSSAAPEIDGTWLLPAGGSKGEEAWRFIATQTGPDVEATILRVDGDTGVLTGRWTGDRFVLGHFSGARPLRLEVTPDGPDRLRLSMNGRSDIVAVREAAAAAAGIGRPADPAAHTRMRDPNAPLEFAFPDLEGRLVRSTDPQFAGKVLLVNVGGSWCPNCHDEAPFLVELDARYRQSGLEVIGLMFEDADEQASPARLPAFLDAYDITYTVLMAGEPADLASALPQAENLNAFPTTFIVGRDGRVRAIHAGFPGPGSGRFADDARRAIGADVERLLAETPPRSGEPRVVLTPSAIEAPHEARGTVRTRLKLAVTMPDGLHVQSHRPADASLVPTALDIDAPPGVRVERIVYPAPDELRLENGAVWPVLGPAFVISVDVSVPAEARRGFELPATLRYQACTSAICHPPTAADTRWLLGAVR